MQGTLRSNLLQMPLSISFSLQTRKLFRNRFRAFDNKIVSQSPSCLYLNNLTSQNELNNASLQTGVQFSTGQATTFFLMGDNADFPATTTLYNVKLDPIVFSPYFSAPISNFGEA